MLQNGSALLMCFPCHLQAVEKALGEAMPHVKPERKTIEKAIKAVWSWKLLDS
jgi:hypothetical protein